MQAALSQLTGLGFSESEARAYTALLASGPLTGYQLARAAAIPRPNVYQVLDRLQARGVVLRIQAEAGSTLYEALPAQEMLDSLSADLGRRLLDAGLALAAVGPPGHTDGRVWNLQSRVAILARARSMIHSTHSELLAGLWSSEAADLAAEMAAAVERGVGSTVLCIQGCAAECGGCSGEVYRYALAPDAGQRWLLLIADERELLVAQLGDADEARGIHTRLDVLTGLASQYLRNAIACAEIVRNLGPRIAGLLDDQARRTLEGSGLAVAGRSWLEGLLEATGQEHEYA